jgi:hypothetical protein
MECLYERSIFLRDVKVGEDSERRATREVSGNCRRSKESDSEGTGIVVRLMLVVGGFRQTFLDSLSHALGRRTAWAKLG